MWKSQFVLPNQDERFYCGGEHTLREYAPDRLVQAEERKKEENTHELKTKIHNATLELFMSMHFSNFFIENTSWKHKNCLFLPTCMQRIEEAERRMQGAESLIKSLAATESVAESMEFYQKMHQLAGYKLCHAAQLFIQDNLRKGNAAWMHCTETRQHMVFVQRLALRMGSDPAKQEEKEVLQKLTLFLAQLTHNFARQCRLHMNGVLNVKNKHILCQSARHAFFEEMREATQAAEDVDVFAGRAMQFLMEGRIKSLPFPLPCFRESTYQIHHH